MILIIEDEPQIGYLLRRVTLRAFPDLQVCLVNNGLAAVVVAQQHAAALRLVVLDTGIPLLDGCAVAAELRAIAPCVPIMPYTDDATRLAVLRELGCVQPVIKGEVALRELPACMRVAMATPVVPLRETAWVTALRDGARAMLNYTHGLTLGLPEPASTAVVLPREQAQKIVRSLEHLHTRMPSRDLRETIVQIQEALL